VLKMGAPAAAVDPLELARLLRPLEAADKLVLAVSGGPDSVALMHLMAQWRLTRAQPSIVVATVDHRLRDGSAAEAAAVSRWAGELGFDHQILFWQGEKPKSRLQEAAREARYHLLTGFARDIEATHLVTAHTLDDQAETILFRLANGSGPLGLIGMRPIVMRAGVAVVRPLLGVTKTWLMGLARSGDWPFFEDPSNHDPRFARTRWRALMPMLAKEGLTERRLVKLSGRIADMATALEQLAGQIHAAALIEASPTRRLYGLSTIIQQPGAIVTQVLALAVQELNGGYTGRFGPRLERLEALAERLRRAHHEDCRFRQTLAGVTISLESGRLSLVPEPARRRGMAASRRTLCSVSD
jgi:tRNA(Ile)-lysidine synthase